jgi:hypothetical protein
VPAKRKYQPGDQVNSWTVINYDPTTQTYRVMCKCGLVCNYQTVRLSKTQCCEYCLRGYKRTDSLIGERFGCRVVIAEIGKTSNRQRIFLVDCDCGREHEFTLDYVLRARKTCLIKPDA